MPLLLVAVGLLGLAVGSFLNVVIHRVPARLSLVAPGSHCPNCEAPVRARHNIPVLGWLVLRGRCADCAAPISARYPIVELVTAALFVAVVADLAALGRLALAPALLFFVAVGIALTAIDLDVMRLPNAIVYPSYGVTAVLLVGAAVVEGNLEPLVRAAVGAAALFAFFLALALAHPGGMGLGDVKLAALVGAVLGFVSFPTLVVGAFAAFVLGSLAGAALLLLRRAGRRTLLPFGPAMIAGALLAVFAAAPLVHTYSALAGSA